MKRETFSEKVTRLTKQHGNSGSVRVFGGKPFKFERIGTKAEAEAFAAEFREKGWQARVVPWEVPFYQRASPKRRKAFESKDPWAIPPDAPRRRWCVYVRRTRAKGR